LPRGKKLFLHPQGGECLGERSPTLVEEKKMIKIRGRGGNGELGDEEGG